MCSTGVAPGCDGIYFSRDQNQAANPRVLSDFSEAGKMDDVVRLIGSP